MSVLGQAGAAHHPHPVPPSWRGRGRSAPWPLTRSSFRGREEGHRVAAAAERSAGRRKPPSPLAGEGEGERAGFGSRLRWFAAFGLLLLGDPAAVAAGFDPFTLADVEDRLGAEVPLDGALVDADGAPATLRAHAGKPVLLAPVDYGCTNICGVTLRGLLQAVDMMALEPGRDFELVVLGIDPRDGPADAAAERAALIGDDADPGIHFLSGDAPPVLDAIGFRYAYDETSDQYAHAAAVAVLTSDGRLARWLYGYPFQPSDLRLALVEAADGEIGTLADRLWLLCYGYDPELGAYTAAVGTALKAGGGLTILALGGFVLVMLRREQGSSSPQGVGPEEKPGSSRPKDGSPEEKPGSSGAKRGGRRDDHGSSSAQRGSRGQEP